MKISGGTLIHAVTTSVQACLFFTGTQSSVVFVGGLICAMLLGASIRRDLAG